MGAKRNGAREEDTRGEWELPFPWLVPPLAPRSFLRPYCFISHATQVIFYVKVLFCKSRFLGGQQDANVL